MAGYGDRLALCLYTVHMIASAEKVWHSPSGHPRVEVVIEVPRGSFLKRGSSGSIDFVSPLPCPFNYGSVETLIGLEGDLLDAIVLGPRLALGSRVIGRALAEEVATAFLLARFTGEDRYVRRLEKVKALEAEE